MDEQITLYTNDLSPYAQRVEIALEEAGVGSQVVRYKVPLLVAGEVKPAWYSEKVNPLGTVPAIALGPQPAPDQPSCTSIKILESLVIVEFIADLYPHAKLIPSDPVERAKARTFTVAGGSAIVSATVAALMGDNVEVLFTGFDKVQSLLSDGTTYAIGNDFSIADISVGPWLARIDLLLENDFFGKFDKSSVTSVVEVYNSPKYDKLREYNRRVQARPSVKKTYLKDAAFQTFRKNLSPKT